MLKVNDKEFQKAFAELARLSRSEDSKIVFNTAKFLTRGLAFRTLLAKRSERARWKFRETQKKKWKGYARSGWQKAWTALGLPGAPAIRNTSLQRKGPGGIVNQSRRIGSPFITVFNDVDYIEALDKDRDILDKAIAFQFRQLTRTIDRIYTAMLRSKSG